MLPTLVLPLLLAPHVVAQHEQYARSRFGCADDEYIIEAEREEAAGWTDETLKQRQRRCDDDPDQILADGPGYWGELSAEQRCRHLIFHERAQCDRSADRLIPWRGLNNTLVSSLCPSLCGRCLCHSCDLDRLTGRCRRGQFCQRPFGGCKNCSSGTYDTNGDPLTACAKCPDGKTSDEGAERLESCYALGAVEALQQAAGSPTRWRYLMEHPEVLQALAIAFGALTCCYKGSCDLLGSNCCENVRNCFQRHASDNGEDSPPNEDPPPNEQRASAGAWAAILRELGGGWTSLRNIITYVRVREEDPIRVGEEDSEAEHSAIHTLPTEM